MKLRLALVIVAALAGLPAHAAVKPETGAFATEVCGLISANARANNIPETFFARLIWKESMFDPGAVSPMGAQGIAQFMPQTASLRGLNDPFDHKEALAVSATYIAYLKNRFGNLGLAAAAYNFGENGASLWKQGRSSLPLETEDYVLFITGRGADWWRDEKADFPIPGIGKGGEFSKECVALVKRELTPMRAPSQLGKWKAWGVVLSGGFSETRALQAFQRIRKHYPALFGNERPLLARKKNLSMGRRAMVQVMVGRDTREEADALCNRMIAQGGACVVEKN